MEANEEATSFFLIFLTENCVTMKQLIKITRLPIFYDDNNDNNNNKTHVSNMF